MFLTKKIIITAVVENTCMRSGLTAHHAQSLLLNFKGNQYLFDVAELFFSFKNNLDVLKILPQKIKAIIISHNHSDHIGALPSFVKQLKNQKIYLPAEIAEKWVKNFQTVLNYKNMEIVKKPILLEKGLWLTGPLGEDQEQSMVIDLEKQGLVILVGCSHPTLPVIVKKAQEITQNKKIFGIIGGFHFKGLTENQINFYTSYLQELNPEFIAPSHCTGYKGILILKKTLVEKVKLSSTGSLGVGNSIEIYPQLKFNLV